MSTPRFHPLSMSEREEAERVRAAYNRKCVELEELEERIAKLEPLEQAELARTAGERRLAAALADPEGVELQRQQAWIESGKARWSDERRDFDIPAGPRWPSGWDPELAVARSLGLVVRVREVIPRAVAEAPPAPLADNPFARTDAQRSK